MRIRLPGRSKYGNKRVTVAGVTWHSKRELAHWTNNLLVRQAAGEITGLRRQVRYDLHAVNKETGDVSKVCAIVVDFEYYEGGKLVVEDTKGFRTEAYKLKKKMLLAEYGLAIREV